MQPSFMQIFHPHRANALKQHLDRIAVRFQIGRGFVVGEASQNENRSLPQQRPAIDNLPALQAHQ